MAKHKFCEVIKAWADGAQIQWRFPNGEDGDFVWTDYREEAAPDWNDPQADFRIKPDADEQSCDLAGVSEVGA